MNSLTFLLRIPFRKGNRGAALFLSLWVAYFALVWHRAIMVDSQYNLSTSHANLWGDWAVHFTMGSAMAFRKLFLSESPLLIGAAFRYPFLVNWISAVLIRVGVPFFSAFVVPSFILSCMAVFTLFFLFKRVFRSQLAAALSTSVFLFNGGIGFVKWINDLLTDGNFWKTIFDPQNAYTKIETLYIYWYSVIETMIVPQRSFTLGLPLALTVLFCIFSFIDQESGAKRKSIRWPRWQLCGVGFLWGLLAVAHTHSFLAVSIIIWFWFLADALRWGRRFIAQRFIQWSFIAGTAVAVAVPLLHFIIFGAHVGTETMRWFPGWYAKEYGISWWLFWWRNWGMTPLVALWGFFLWLSKQPNLRLRWWWAIWAFPFLPLIWTWQKYNNDLFLSQE